MAAQQLPNVGILMGFFFYYYSEQLCSESAALPWFRLSGRSCEEPNQLSDSLHVPLILSPLADQ